MSGVAQRFIEQGLQQGIEQGVQRGEARILMSLLRLRFGELPDVAQQRLETADTARLLRWSARVLTARRSRQDCGGPSESHTRLWKN